MQKSFTLRPEATASVCRAYIEHNLQQLPQPVKLYYMGPMFRRERPQKGRYRQFYQIGAEVLGGSDAPADDEHVLRHGLEAQDAVGRHHPGVLHVDAREPRRLGADAHDQVIELVPPVTSHDGVTVDDTVSPHHGDLVALACRLNAAALLEDDLLLAGHHPREVE